MKIVNSAIAGTKPLAVQKKKEWNKSGKFTRVTIVKKKTAPSLKGDKRYGSYFYIVNAWQQ